MVTNKERHEVARELRQRMYEGYDFTGLNIADQIGIDYNDPYLFHDNCWLRLADLIEPEPERTCEWMQDEDGNWHTSCGNVFTVCNCDGLEENHIFYCYNCGGSVLEAQYDDDEW